MQPPEGTGSFACLGSHPLANCKEIVRASEPKSQCTGNNNKKRHNRAGGKPVVNSSYCKVDNTGLLVEIVPFHAAWHQS